VLPWWLLIAAVVGVAGRVVRFAFEVPVVAFCAAGAVPVACAAVVLLRACVRSGPRGVSFVGVCVWLE